MQTTTLPEGTLDGAKAESCNWTRATPQVLLVVALAVVGIWWLKLRRRSDKKVGQKHGWWLWED